MKNLKDDFTSTDIVYFKIDDREFGYQPMSSGDELELLSYEGDQAVINIIERLKRISVAPYTKDQIKASIGLDKDYSELSHDERAVLFKKLRGKLVSRIVAEIKNIEQGDEEDLKNSSLP